MKGAKKKPEVTPELIEACKQYKESEEKLIELSKQETAIYRQQRPYEKIIQRFSRKSVPELRGQTLKAGQFKIRVSSAGYVRKVT